MSPTAAAPRLRAVVRRQPVAYGIPVTRGRRGHAKVPVSVRLRRRERPRALPARRATPGSRAAATSDGDRHAIVVDKSTCRLYETFATRTSSGRLARRLRRDWSLTSNKLRPQGWTSADAAGLPILPGLLR